MAHISLLGYEKFHSALGWPLYIHSHPTFQAGFPAIKPCFSARTGLHCPRVLIESLFISGCVRVTDLFRIAEISSENSLKCSNMRELEDEVCLNDLEAKNECEN